MKRAYHTFKRTLPDSGPDDAPWITKALIKPGKDIVTIRLSEQHITEAIRRKGFADGQNCAGGICVLNHKKSFGHEVMPLVDWWYHRVYVCESINRKTGKATCRVYAHYDGVAELFDGDQKDLKKLLDRIRKDGFIDITLYPIKRGQHPRTGNKTNYAGPSGKAGKKRPIGAELRILSHLRAFSNIKSLPQDSAD